MSHIMKKKKNVFENDLYAKMCILNFTETFVWPFKSSGLRFLSNYEFYRFIRSSFFSLHIMSMDYHRILEKGDKAS